MRSCEPFLLVCISYSCVIDLVRTARVRPYFLGQSMHRSGFSLQHPQGTTKWSKIVPLHIQKGKGKPFQLNKSNKKKLK